MDEAARFELCIGQTSTNTKFGKGEITIMRQLSYTIEPEADGLSVNSYARNIAGLSRAFLRSVKFR